MLPGHPASAHFLRIVEESTGLGKADTRTLYTSSCWRLRVSSPTDLLGLPWSSGLRGMMGDF
jgi:hypothetical protein